MATVDLKMSRYRKGEIQNGKVVKAWFKPERKLMCVKWLVKGGEFMQFVHYDPRKKPQESSDWERIKHLLILTSGRHFVPEDLIGIEAAVEFDGLGYVRDAWHPSVMLSA